MADKKTGEKKAKKTDGEKKARNKRPRLDAMIDSLNKAGDAEARAKAIMDRANKTILKGRAAVETWAKSDTKNMSVADLSAALTKLKAAGFEPPKERLAVEPIVPGTAVELIPDFYPTYKQVYTDEELSSMVYEYMDPVNKTGMCKTSGRYVAVKFKHVVVKGINDAPIESPVADASAEQAVSHDFE